MNLFLFRSTAFLKRGSRWADVFGGLGVILCCRAEQGRPVRLGLLRRTQHARQLYLEVVRERLRQGQVLARAGYQRRKSQYPPSASGEPG